MDLTKRSALAVTMAAAAMCGVITSACSGDDTAVPVDGGSDATSDTTFVPHTDGATDDAAIDSGTDAGIDATPSGPHPNVYFVHGAIDLPPVQLCFAVGSAADGTDGMVQDIPPFPASDTIAPGRGRAIDPVADYEAVAITPIVVTSGMSTTSCKTLLGAHGVGTFDNPPGTLTSQVDFFALPTIAAAELASGRSYVATLRGCLPLGSTPDAGEDPNASVARCGADYDGGQPTFTLSFAELDTSTSIASTSIGVQVAHESVALEGIFAGGGILPAFLDGGAIVSSPMHAGDLAPDAALVVPGVDESSAAIRVTLLQSDGGVSPQSPFVQSLAWTATLSGGDGGTFFANGHAYTFVLVGDPSIDGGTADPHLMHFIAVPNDF